MKVKKFIASSMPEAMKQIRAELGADAVILNSKEIRIGGILGLFKKRKIEVIAGLDTQPNTPTKQKNASHHKHQPVINTYETKQDNNDSDVLTEIKHMKKILEQQARRSGSEYLPDFQLVYQYLLDQEVEENLAKELMDNVISKHERSELVTQKSVLATLKEIIEDRLEQVSYKGITYDQKIIQFVGPTGVGKTTTLAKIAANCMLIDKKKVAFITTDTYRIAAIEQLKTYARILDVPVEVAYTIDDYHEAINKFSTYDVILVDTAGRNFRDEKYVREIQKSIGIDTKTYLVLSLTAKPNDMIDIYNQFKHLNISEVIFTKLDETLQYGSMINMALSNKVGIGYITNGQDVPNDILRPTPQMITEFLLGRYFYE